MQPSPSEAEGEEGDDAAAIVRYVPATPAAAAGPAASVASVAAAAAAAAAPDASSSTPASRLSAAAASAASVMDVYCTQPVTRYEKISKIGEGTYGTADRARDKLTGDIVALKKIRMTKEKAGFPLTSIREVKLLKALHHRHLVRLLALAAGRRPDSIFLVFEYCSTDMASLCDRHAALMAQRSSAAAAASTPPLFSESQTKRLTLQLLSAVSYLHSHFTMHRDLKLSNLLLSASGQVKVADFGLARLFSNPLELFSYTPKVVTLWYRAPELLLASAFPAAAASASASYHSAVDIWAVGCIVAELLLGRPLFPGSNEAEQLELICRLLGSPNDKIWPAFSLLQPPPSLPHYPYNQLAAAFGHVGRQGVALLGRLLTYDPSKRITADKAQRHPWFTEQPTPTDEECMPAWQQQQQQQLKGAADAAPADRAATAGAAPASHASSPASAAVGGKRKRSKEAVDSGSDGKRRAVAAAAAVEQQRPAAAGDEQQQQQAGDGDDSDHR